MQNNNLSEHEEKKLSIINAAITLFGERGYRGVSIRNIADKAGCNLASISYYFGGKEGLYSACFQCFEKRKLVNCTSILRDPSNREDVQIKLLAFYKSFSDLVSSNEQLVRMIAVEMFTLTTLAQELRESFYFPVHHSLKTFFDEALEKKIIKSEVSSGLLSRGLISTLIREMVFVPKQENLFLKSELSKRIINICTGSIYA
jgi:AcrR family transcriptional regulator